MLFMAKLTQPQQEHIRDFLKRTLTNDLAATVECLQKIDARIDTNIIFQTHEIQLLMRKLSLYWCEQHNDNFDKFAELVNLIKMMTNVGGPLAGALNVEQKAGDILLCKNMLKSLCGSVKDNEGIDKKDINDYYTKLQDYRKQVYFCLVGVLKLSDVEINRLKNAFPFDGTSSEDPYVTLKNILDVQPPTDVANDLRSAIHRVIANTAIDTVDIPAAARSIVHGNQPEQNKQHELFSRYMERNESSIEILRVASKICMTIPAAEMGEVCAEECNLTKDNKFQGSDDDNGKNDLTVNEANTVNKFLDTISKKTQKAMQLKLLPAIQGGEKVAVLDDNKDYEAIDETIRKLFLGEVENIGTRIAEACEGKMQIDPNLRIVFFDTGAPVYTQMGKPKLVAFPGKPRTSTVMIQGINYCLYHDPSKQKQTGKVFWLGPIDYPGYAAPILFARHVGNSQHEKIYTIIAPFFPRIKGKNGSYDIGQEEWITCGGSVVELDKLSNLNFSLPEDDAAVHRNNEIEKLARDQLRLVQ